MMNAPVTSPAAVRAQVEPQLLTQCSSAIEVVMARLLSGRDAHTGRPLAAWTDAEPLARNAG